MLSLLIFYAAASPINRMFFQHFEVIILATAANTLFFMVPVMVTPYTLVLPALAKERSRSS